MTGWNRRSRAASFSMYLRYSSSVVAPMHCSSPRDSGGFRMFAASIAPSAAPAPTMRVELVDEQDRVVGVAKLLDDLLEPLLELAAVLGAGHEGADVEGQDALVEQDVRDVARDDAMGEALGDGGLAHAGLADQCRVVLGLPAEDLDDPLDLLLAADHRVQLVGAGGLGEVDAERVHRGGLAGALGLLGGSGRGRLRKDSDDLVADLVEVHAQALEHAGGDALALAHEPEEQVLRADVVVAEPARLVDRELDDPLGARRQAHLADDGAITAADDELDRRPDLGQLDVHVLEHARRHAFALADRAPGAGAPSRCSCG